MGKSKDMLVLGVETSCDETAIALVSKGKKVLSSIITSSLPLHKKYGGVVPEIACRHHTELINIIFLKALKKAGVSPKDIDAIGVTQGPGLVGALLVGISFAKALSYSLKKPLIPINHLHAHLYSAAMNTAAPTFPAIGLIISGGHSSLVHMKDVKNVKLLGQTRDDACGEAFDKVAKVLGLGFPGGPVIEKMAKRGNPKKIKFPRSYLEKESLDFSFSGIKTAVLYCVEDFKKEKKRVPVSDICASFQEAMFDMLLYKTRACLHKSGIRALLVGGGVSANGALRERLAALAASLGTEIFLPAEGMYTDNAAMVAGLAYHLYDKEKPCDWRLTAEPSLSF